MNSFGHLFKVQIFGESHGKAVGVIIDGCPPGIALPAEDFQLDLNRRRSGAKGTTKRKEPDIPEVLSGINQGLSTGSPISLIFKNTDTRSQDYNFRETPRPGHADYTGRVKFKGYNDERGGGHFSGRLTAGVVAAGVIAKKIIPDIGIQAKITEAGGSTNINQAVEQAVKDLDSIGAIIECTASGLPAGLGEPFWASAESLISAAVFSVPGIRGIEFGAGFFSAKMKGSEHNDSFINSEGKTKTNHAGGINGGITNGNPLIFRVAVKPTSSIAKVQETYNFAEKRPEQIRIKGRHDACIALRMPVIIEAVTAIVLADFYLLQKMR